MRYYFHEAYETLLALEGWHFDNTPKEEGIYKAIDTADEEYILYFSRGIWWNNDHRNEIYPGIIVCYKEYR